MISVNVLKNSYLSGGKPCKERVVYMLFEDLVQSLVEANYGRELTDEELTEFHYSLYEDNDVNWQIDHAILEAASKILKKE